MSFVGYFQKKTSFLPVGGGRIYIYIYIPLGIPWTVYNHWRLLFEWLDKCRYPLGNDHISHQTGKGKSSSSKVANGIGDMLVSRRAKCTVCPRDPIGYEILKDSQLLWLFGSCFKPESMNFLPSINKKKWYTSPGKVCIYHEYSKGDIQYLSPKLRPTQPQ